MVTNCVDIGEGNHFLPIGVSEDLYTRYGISVVDP